MFEFAIARFGSRFFSVLMKSRSACRNFGHFMPALSARCGHLWLGPQNAGIFTAEFVTRDTSLFCVLP